MNEGPAANENDPGELERFIVLLERLRDACGRPSLRELSRVSKNVRKHYGGRYPQLPAELSLTALSDVLGRRRKKPPTWNWVALYVLSCQRYAADSGVRPDPKDTTLPTWHLRLQAVHRADVRSPADEEIIPANGDGRVQRQSSPSSSPSPSPPAPPSSRGSGPSTSARRDPLSAPTPLDRPGPPSSDVERPDRHDRRPGGPGDVETSLQVAELEAYIESGGTSLSERRLFGLYGTHGVHLLRSAEDRDHDAEYRLGVLLCIDDRPHESLAWLLRADAGGHTKARELIEHPAPRRAALAHAWRLGSQTGADDDEIAALYLERAARNGHLDAAFELGALHMGREEPRRAADWFALASGSPARMPPSVPTVEELLTRLYGEPPAGDALISPEDRT
ncbi:MAG TPA: hypothetical protein VFU43_16860 [Streptosporangiaceae bacterium]|nr:hypothetical protein [Streptosporangiaceae bacterium]